MLANTSSNLDALFAEADKLNAQYAQRVNRRVERALRGLVSKRWKARFGAALRSTKGMSFLSRKARWDYAVKRTGIFRDELSGEFDPSAAWVTSGRELESLIEVSAARSPSLLTQAAELGSDASELAAVVIAARNSVRLPRRLEQITTALERADAAYRQEHAAEIEADIAKQRVINRSRASRWSSGGADAVG